MLTIFGKYFLNIISLYFSPSAHGISLEKQQRLATLLLFQLQLLDVASANGAAEQNSSSGPPPPVFSRFC